MVENFDLPVAPSTPGSAGVDLCSTVTVYIQPKETILIDTGWKIWIKDPNYAGLIMARSSIAVKKGLAPANKVGLIDSDYQGPLKVALHNHSSTPELVNIGDRIAQLVIIPVVPFELSEVLTFESNTVRGNEGFGSTGVTVSDNLARYSTVAEKFGKKEPTQLSFEQISGFLSK